MLKDNREKLVEILKETLSHSQVDFHLNFERLYTPLAVIKKYLPEKRSKILDLGCGAGVFDLFLYWGGYEDITAVDDDKQLTVAQDSLKEIFNLKTVNFYTSSMEQYVYPKDEFSLIIIHDVLWSPKIDIFALLPQISYSLKPRGLIFFDIWLQEFGNLARGISALLPGYNVYRSFKRYKVAECEKALQKNKFKLLGQFPLFSENPLKGLLQRLLWKTLKKTNAMYFLGQKL